MESKLIAQEQMRRLTPIKPGVACRCGQSRQRPQPRCGWEGCLGDDPRWLVPRNLGLGGGIPLGFKMAERHLRRSITRLRCRLDLRESRQGNLAGGGVVDNRFRISAAKFQSGGVKDFLGRGGRLVNPLGG